MFRNKAIIGALALLCTILSAGTLTKSVEAAAVAAGQNPAAAHAPGPTAPPAVPQITQAINDANRVTLAGNTNSKLVAGTDLGAVSPNLSLQHMQLLMQRSPEREQALKQYIDELHTATSPNFHQWLTAPQFGSLYGPAQSDISAVTAWLGSQGLTVNSVYPNGMFIDFSGPASAVQKAFGAQLHNYEVDGKVYMSNTADPSIPAAMAKAVVGVTSLNNYFPHPLMNKHKGPSTLAPRFAPSASSTDSIAKVLHIPQFNFNDGFNEYFVAPGDFNTIYNVSPLWAQNIRGAGQTIVVIEDTTMYEPDWQTFRTAFGLDGFAGTFTQVAPLNPAPGPNNCFPTNNSDEGEAALDAEWAGVAAPDADIVLAECDDTATVFGGLIAVQNLLNTSAAPPAIMSISYGECEALNGAASNASFNTTYQQAVTEGTTIIVSSGDESAVSCDANRVEATHGIGVSGFASTIYNVAVGGTDFSDTAHNTNATYWGTVTDGSGNDAFGGSALSYVPEIPWNDSCASSTFIAFLIANTAQTGITSTDPVAFCNTTLAKNGLAPVGNWLAFPSISTGSGSGGPSGCATGAATTSGVISGTCAGYAQPAFQSASLAGAAVFGMPANSVRNIPDVSLFASNGQWGHALWLCNSDTTEGGGTCDFANDPQDAELVNAAGGTSFAAPAYAGIQALINQASGSRQGNMNIRLYQLGAQEYGTVGNPNNAGLTNCNSELGAAVGSTCVFRDITTGDFDVPCRLGTPNCFNNSPGTLSNANCNTGAASHAKICGVVSTSTTALQPAYQSAPGWDFTTGLGSINATNLVNAMATHLVFTTEPNASYAPGAAISVQVSIEDGTNTVATNLTSPVTLTLSGGAAGATLNGTTTVNAVAGVATFSVSVNKASATAYTLNAASGTITGAASTAFTISVGAATGLAFTVQPSETAAGAAITPAVKVSLVDAFGNVETGDSTDSVTLALASGTDPSFTGGGPITFVNGTATFPGVTLTLAGDYMLGATTNAPGAFTATSTSFTVDPGDPDHIEFTVQPTDTTAGVAINPAVVITEYDLFENVETGDSFTHVSLTANGPGGLTGAGLGTLTNGVVSYNDLVLATAGTYALDAVASELFVESSSFVVSPATGAKLAFVQQPVNVTQGTTETVQVAIEDADNNVETADNATSITLSAPACGGSVTIGTATVVDGVATFNHRFFTVATLNLTATATGDAGATSSIFQVTANAGLIFADGFEGCQP